MGGASRIFGVVSYCDDGGDTIKQILYNNKYDTRILNKITWTNDVQEKKKVKTQTKWGKFTYVGWQTKFITKYTQVLKSRSKLTTP
jgi:hypothetical protein